MTGLLLSGLLLTQTPATVPPSPPPSVPPLIAAQVEAYELREQLYVQTLAIARERIDAAVAVALPGWRIDWQAKRLVPVGPAPAAKEATP